MPWSGSVRPLRGGGGGQEVGEETEAVFRASTGRGTALEVETATSERLRKSGNRCPHLSPEVKEPWPQEGTGLWG